MKQFILSLVFLFTVNVLFSQEVMKLGIVKGKQVTYRVSRFRGSVWRVMNIHNPDTMKRTYPLRFSGEVQNDIELQLIGIIRAHLSSDELSELSKKDDFFSIELRLDSSGRKLLQVVCFDFKNRYDMGLRIPPEKRRTKFPESYDGFWLNFDPDRLHEIEKDIVSKLKLPELSEDDRESFLKHDWGVYFDSWEICDVEKAKAKWKKEIEERKKWQNKKW